MTEESKILAMFFSNRIENRTACRNSVDTHARTSFGLVLSLGLPFSVIFGPPNALVPLARNKTHKGAASPIHLAS